MTSVATTPSDIRAVPAVARGFLRLLDSLGAGSLRLVTPSGEHLVFRGEHSGPDATLRINDWSACGKILKGGDIGVAECYRDELIDTPDLLALLMLALANQDILEQALHGSFWGTLLYRLRHLMNRNTKTGSRKNIHAHYDIGNDFYRLWLDPSMTYSSALFHDGTEPLEAAQYAKYDRLLDLLEVKAGDHILEIGCGWGALAERAATRGCRVTGISLSSEQLAHARERVRGTPAERLTDFRFLDYRDLEGRFDAIVSIEMLEAVGKEFWGGYFNTLRRSLKPGGKAALQTITIADERFDSYQSGTDFIQQYIFPGGMLPSPSALKRHIRHASLDLLDIHSFGPDYARTLRLWRENFEAALPAIRGQGFDEAFIRLWRFYLCYCEAGFLTGRTSVYQVLMTY
ncbi:MAG TPA: cyclopropane-fatty-acyl-phospholipid synthase family protein [Moraxellaceae bacterium]|nr:cyclopropane-fatty-acyl-phospholipid synthase family protein [Moraxellaceae bacterium]